MTLLTRRLQTPDRLHLSSVFLPSAEGGTPHHQSVSAQLKSDNQRHSACAQTAQYWEIQQYYGKEGKGKGGEA
jgi:hypothetical protein